MMLFEDRHISDGFRLFSDNIQIAVTINDINYNVASALIIDDDNALNILNSFKSKFHFLSTSEELLDLYFALQKQVYRVYLSNQSLNVLSKRVGINSITLYEPYRGESSFEVMRDDFSIPSKALSHMSSSEILEQILLDKVPLYNVHLVSDWLLDFRIFPRAIVTLVPTINNYSIMDLTDNYASFGSVDDAKAMIETLYKDLSKELKIETLIDLPF